MPIIITFAIGFTVACWLLVIGHQLDWQGLNLARYPNLGGSLFLAYTGAAMSVAIPIAAVLVSLLAPFRK